MGAMDERLMERYLSREGAEEYARKYLRSPLRRFSNRREFSVVRRALAVAGASGEVLDVPCAAGRLVPVLLERASRVTAVDLSPAMVEVARASHRAEVEAGRAIMVEGAAESLPFPDGAFDTAVCWRLLHHLTDRAVRLQIMRELARVSRRAVVASFADSSTVKARLQRLRGRNRRCVKWTSAEFATEAREAGLIVRETFRLSTCFSIVAAAVLVPQR